MKKNTSIVILAICIAGLFIFWGFNIIFGGYTNSELEMINTANHFIEQKYDVNINNNDYLFSVGRQVKADQFVALSSKVESEVEFKKNVVVSAQINKKPKEGQVISYAVIFNRETLEIVEISADK